MTKVQYQLGLIITIVLLLTLIPSPEPAYAQWPPFRFQMTPSYEDGRVTYQIELDDRVEWAMTNVTIKIPLPAGTRFLEAKAIPTIETGFDGTEVTFFIPVLSHSIDLGDAFFVVEVSDPALTIFSVQPWITWQGDQPGDYLPEKVDLNLAQQTVVWPEPPRPRLQLEARATAADGIITYYIYPKNVGSRMWDLKINVPLPEGTTYLSAEAPPSFVASFNGQEVSFSTVELERKAEIAPLIFKVSAGDAAAPLVTTHAWATWKNTGRRVGQSIVSQEETRTGDIIVQPHSAQQVVADTIGDVPFSNYDITSIALQEVALQDGGLALKVIFYTVGVLGPLGQPLEYNFYIDTDCRIDTGDRQDFIGAEYQIRYRHENGRADFRQWEAQTDTWDNVEQLKTESPPGSNRVTVWAPYSLFEGGGQFCWLLDVKNRTTAFDPRPPTETLPDNEPKLSLYEPIATTELEIEAGNFVDGPSSGTFIDVGDLWQYQPGWSEPPPTWNMVDFNDEAWFSGPTNIGYGQGKFATDLNQVISSIQSGDKPILVERVDKQSGMILAVLPTGDDGTSVFMRRTFTVTNPALLTQLELEVEYAGGFVAYLNGVEVARRGLGRPGAPPAFDALAADQPARTSEVIDLSDYIAGLVPGVNVLAIQAHRSTNSLNLSIAPKLTWQSNPANTALPGNASLSAQPPISVPPASLSITDIRGKLAVPLDQGRGVYDVHVFSLPDGQEIARIPNARQPNFRFDGQRMLINHEGGGIENVFEYNFADGTETQVTDAPQDWHPFYDPWGNRVVYGNAELTVGSPEWVTDEHGRLTLSSIRKPFIFVQCGLLPPHQETEPRCRNIPWLGVLVPAGQTGEIQGTHPVWTANDMIAYKGCNTWAGSGLCGIYIVPAASTKGFSDGFIPSQLSRDTSDIPSDTKGNLIAFSSRRDGNWEAYVMNLDGSGVKNVSNSPASNDGLPALSPDGNWVAFVSDRGGQWAVWVVSLAGGPAQKLFDLPADNPWGNGSRVWTNERISWGP